MNREDTKTRAIPGDGFKDPKVFIYHTKAFDMTAQLGTALLEKAMLGCMVPDGEDSTGRQKARLATPAEMAQKAFDTAEAFMDLAYARNHIVEVPDIPEEKAE